MWLAAVHSSTFGCHNPRVAARLSTGSPLHLIRFSGPVLGLAFAIATIIVIRFTVPWATTYSGQSAAALGADLVAGFGLMVLGMLVRREGQEDTSGLLALLAGVVWLAPDWIGWQDGPPLARSIASVVAPLFLPIVLHLVLAFQRPRSLDGRVRIVVAIAYGLVAIASVAQALVRDPLVDPYCWNNCTDNSFLVAPQIATADTLRTILIVFALGIGTAIAVASLYRLIRSTPAARRKLWVVLAPGFLVGAFSAVHAGALLRTPVEGPQSETYAALFQMRAWSVGALVLGLAWTVRRADATRSAVARLATDLGEAPRPGSLSAALRRATNDSTLEVAHWLPEAGRFADANGRRVEEPTPGEGRAITPVVRDGLPVAIVLHDASSVTPERLQRELGPAARLAVDNERLQAEVLGQLADLRDSRARIVEAEDRERQRLERNLHDGAQQRLLALSYDVRVARSGDESNDSELTALLDSAVDDLQGAIDELRELAHGLFPAILTEVGLGQALLSMAEAAPFPVELIETTEERFAQPVERAAYVVISGALEKAFELGAPYVGIRASKEGDRLVIRIEGAGSIPLTHLGDRVGALGGRVMSDGSIFRAEIPCA